MRRAAGVAETEPRAEDDVPCGRRVLAVLECQASDDAVLERALDVVARSGGYLTVVAVVPSSPSWLHCGPYCVPHAREEEMRACASRALARAALQIPPEVPLLTGIETGRIADVIARRVDAAAHDLVVVGRRSLALRKSSRSTPAAVLVVAH